MKILKKIFFLSLFFLFIISTDAQNFTKYRGVPYIKNYSAKQYNAHEINFDVIQNDVGIMYFANFAGILEFDGSRWNKIPTSTGTRVLSFDKDNTGTIFVGGLYDFGYLKQNNKGVTNFASLTHFIKNNDNKFEIFSVNCLENSTYFVSAKEMFVYKDSSITTITFENIATSSFVVNNKFYIFFERKFNNNTLLQNGLTVFENNNFTQITDNSSAQIVDVRTMLNVEDEDGVIIGTAKQGFFILQNNSINDFDAPISEFIIKHGLRNGTQINENLYALGTLTAGVVLVNKRGELIQNIDKKSNLQDETVNAIYSDKLKSLWVASDIGLSKIDINNNLMFYNSETTNLQGKIKKISSFNEKLFFATDKGLFYLQNTVFSSISEIDYACWDLITVKSQLLVASSGGIYSVKNGKAESLEINDFTFCLTNSVINENIVYSGHNGKIRQLELKSGKWFVKKIITGGTLNNNVTKICEASDGDLFFEVNPGKIMKYDLENNEILEIKPDKELILLHINKKANQIFFSSEKGLFIYDEKTNKLVKYNLFNNDKTSNKLWIYNFVELPNGNFLFTDGEQKNLSLFRKTGSEYIQYQTPFLPIADFSVQTIFYDAETSRIYTGGKNGVIMFNYENEKNYKPIFNTIIRKIICINQDSLINIPSSKNQLTKLKYSENSIRFEFTAPVYPAKGEVQYRYFLKGFDRDTSEWTIEPYKEYTNLPDAHYIFIVESKNEFGKIINKTSFEFKIITPFFRRWWAFIIYGAIFIIILKLIFDWRMRVSKKEKEALETLVKERTEEIEQSKKKIEEQRDIAYNQRKEILDSINYALRIQNAVLPSKQDAEKMLKEHFIIFKPCEIVSGDFYWLKEVEQNNILYKIVVVADCTGHGVPGAFMSMLGTSFLNEIVTHNDLTNAATILDQLRIKVKTSLHQEGKANEQKDGMDVALYIINTKNNELHFAGAYNPLYIIRNKKNISEPDLEKFTNNKNYKIFKPISKIEFSHTIIEIKANRQPIGIYLKERDFINNDFQLQKDDALYTFSDGYIDQFGGETGGKFKTKRFKELLLNVQDKTMLEQKQILERNLIKWMGDLHQVDDIIIIGLKIG